MNNWGNEGMSIENGKINEEWEDEEVHKNTCYSEKEIDVKKKKSDKVNLLSRRNK